MLRIRLHGRGGQGIKTASQILGSAAFFSGFQVQDFPLYGPERRGAPIVANARIDHHPILERGAIAHPDILLVGDETLLEDPMAAPLAGISGSTQIFINSAHAAESLKEHFKLSVPPTQADLTELCIKHLNHGKVLSAALAAAAVRMMGGIELSCLIKSIRAELGEHGLRKEVLGRNISLAREVFETIVFHPASKREDDSGIASRPLVDLQPVEVADGAPIIQATANMALRKTGNWRMYRPAIDYEGCNGCLVCFVRCPDGAIGLRSDAMPQIDYDHCKGCLTCVEECPKHAITFSREVTSWS